MIAQQRAVEGTCEWELQQEIEDLLELLRRRGYTQVALLAGCGRRLATKRVNRLLKRLRRLAWRTDMGE